MTAAVIELDSLPDAIRPAAQDENFLAGRRIRFVLLVKTRIHIGRVGLKLRRAGIDSLENGSYIQLLSQTIDTLRPHVPRRRETSVRHACALHPSQLISRDLIGRLLSGLSQGVLYFLELVQEPGINRGHLGN